MTVSGPWAVITGASSGVATALAIPIAPVERDRMTAAWRTLAVAALAVFIVSLDTTVLFVAFPSIRATFSDVSSEGISWILNIYTIGYGALLVPTGRLADRFGRRRFFLAGIVVFVVASLLCGVAPNVAFLVAARGLQSLGAALLMPASFALVLHAFPTERRGVAIGIWGAVGALAAAIGPAVGSAIVQFASWRWVFFLNLPLGLYAVVVGRRRVDESRASEQGGLPDAVGTALLIASFGVIAYGIVGARENPSNAAAAILLGMALLALFVFRSLRVSAPALDVRLFRRRTFAVANAMTLVFSIAFTAMFFGNVFFLTERWHRSIFEAGLWISPGPLIVIPVAIFAGRRADRIGYRPLFIAGGLLYAMGAAWMLHVASEGARFLLWLPSSIAMGTAIGMVLPSLSGASALELDAATYGVGSGVNQAVRQFGSVLGVAVVVVVLGRLGEAAPFERVFVLLIIGGLLTALGGLATPAPKEKPMKTPTHDEQKATRKSTELHARYGPWAVVTGASDGIGREFALRLADAGFDLVIVARRGGVLDELRAELEARAGVRVLPIAADLATSDGVRAVVEGTSRLDVGLLVAAAGFGTSGRFIDSRLEEELGMIDVNCRAVAALSHHFGQRFANAGRGGLVLMSSLLAFQGVPGAANYSATKAFVQSLAEGLRLELSPRGVDVVSSAPGPIQSGFGKRADMKMSMAGTAASVAKGTLDALGRTGTVSPGVLSKFLAFALAFLPRWGRVRMMGLVMAGMTKHRLPRSLPTGKGGAA